MTHDITGTLRDSRDLYEAETAQHERANVNQPEIGDTISPLPPQLGRFVAIPGDDEDLEDDWRRNNLLTLGKLLRLCCGNYL